MNFRVRYLLYVLALHVVIVYLTFRLLRENKPLFIAAEVLLLISAYVAVRLYREFRRPSEFVASGIEAIKEKDFTIKFVPTGNREVDELIHVYNLMIDQLRQERVRQREQQFFLEKLIEASPIAILIFDFDDRIDVVNPKAAQVLQVADGQLFGKELSETGHPVLVQLAGLQDGESRTIKTNGIETYKASKSFLIDRGFRRSFVMMEELTRELLETERKSYGQVIRMMAHEVNNSIGAVNSILDVTKSVIQDGPKIGGLKPALQVAIERNDRLNRFMRRFADVVRLPPPHKTPADWNDLARSVAELMQPMAQSRGVQFRYQTYDQPVERPLDVVQIEQVLVNIVKNALEACQPGDSVEISVGAHQLRIRDNGTPIPDEVAARLFEPFFSTRPDGQGIGLTLTRDILHNHSLTFSLKTNADGWTEFVIAY